MLEVVCGWWMRHVEIMRFEGRGALIGLVS